MNAHKYAQKLAVIGIETPEPIRNALAMQEAISAAVFDQPLHGLEGEVLAGTIPAADAARRMREAAIDLAVHDKIKQVAQDLNPLVERTLRRAVLETADEVVIAMRPTFDAAIADLSTFTHRYGIGPEPAHILETEGGSEAWEAFTVARNTLDAIERVCRELQQNNYYPQPPVAAFVVGVANGAQLSEAVALCVPSEQMWERLIVAGYALHLNTAEEAQAILNAAAAHDNAAAAQAEAEKRARVDAYRAKVAAQMEVNAEQAKAMRKRIGVTR